VNHSILVCGHRGARAVLPENTLPAFEYAIAVGADALEMDVAVTRDEVLVVSHDPRLNPAICRSPGGPRLIRELTLAELQRWDCGTLRHRRFPRQTPVPGARIPTLDQVLSLARRGPFQFNIEIKIFPQHPAWTPPPERLVQLVCQAIQRHGLEPRVVVQSFDFRALHALARLAPAIRRAALYVGRPASLVRIAQRAGAAIVSPYHRLATRRRVARAHAAGLQVVPWTANRPRDWARLIAAQVDGIITDDPEGLMHYLQARGLPNQ
jgi:glycerophosphoryl diester phosphodiesterase